MNRRPTIWTRIKRFLRPETETYETRRARGEDEVHRLGTQHYEATDRRRHGGSADGGA
jgi:hypothetical protein